MELFDAAGRAEIDEALERWRQGDCVLGEQWFVFRLDIDAPLTNDAQVAAAKPSDLAATEVLGFMVATQTCDIVRSCSERPFLEVCPLVKVEEATLREIERGRRPNYAYVPGVADQLLVADLDRVMTVEKAVVAKWDWVGGCNDESDVRRLSIALARKRARVAFPDDFVGFASPLMRRMSSKHDKHSDEGLALRDLREIRVQALPSWDADEVELMFRFIRDADEPPPGNQAWHQYLEAWLERVKPSGRFTTVDGLVQTLEDMTAREYVESDVLDLDHLSRRAETQ